MAGGKDLSRRFMLIPSRNYVRKVLENLTDVRVGDPVVSIRRNQNPKQKLITIKDGSGTESEFDHVIMAVHTDTALKILGDGASDLEREILGSIKYVKNRAVLHRDVSVLSLSFLLSFHSL